MSIRTYSRYVCFASAQAAAASQVALDKTRRHFFFDLKRRKTVSVCSESKELLGGKKEK